MLSRRKKDQKEFDEKIPGKGLIMKGNFSRVEKTVIVIGFLLVITGVISNEWLIARLFSPDGVLQTLTRLSIWIFDLFMVGTGLLLIFFGKRHQLMHLTVLLVTLLICFPAAEIIFRLIEYKLERIPIAIENPHGTGSYRLKPNFDFVTKVDSKQVIIKTNSLGMPWREVTYENPLKKKRIAFIGDSFTFGIWADSIEKSFVGVVDSLLHAEKCEVLNFGVVGYGLPDIELQIKEEILAFKPDYLILMFYNGNDFKDTYLGKDKYKIDKGILIWDKANQNKKVPKIFRSVSFHHSLLSRFALYRRFNRLISKLQTTENSKFSSNFRVGKSFGSESFWSQTDYPDVAVKAKDISLMVLDNIRSLAYKNNIQLIIVSIPFKQQVYAVSASGKNYDNINYNINLPQKYIEEYSKLHSVPYLDLLPALRSYVRKENKDIYIPNDIHFNNEGHYIVGIVVTNFLKERTASIGVAPICY